MYGSDDMHFLLFYFLLSCDLFPQNEIKILPGTSIFALDYSPFSDIDVGLTYNEHLYAIKITKKGCWGNIFTDLINFTSVHDHFDDVCI